MENYKVLGVVNDTLAKTIKFTNYVNVGFREARCIDPCLSQDDGLAELRVFALDRENLFASVLTQNREASLYHLL